MAGEHTNYGNIRDRIEKISGRKLLLSDLTVPPGNQDQSGPLRGGGITPWPVDAILNRGASVPPSKLRSRVLLAGDGWWAEPDLKEWLWAGDYIFRSDDRSGPIPLATATDDGAARWIVVGDSSPFINQQIIADPRPLILLLQLSTLWPAFLRDALIALLVAGVFIYSRRSLRSPVPGAIAILMMISVAVLTAPPSASHQWRNIYQGESGFDSNNFNLTLAQDPKLFEGGWALKRLATFPVESHTDAQLEPEIIFGLVKNRAAFGSVVLSHCWRLGGTRYRSGSQVNGCSSVQARGARDPLDR